MLNVKLLSKKGYKDIVYIYCESVVNLFFLLKEGKEIPLKTVISSRMVERDSFKL